MPTRYTELNSPITLFNSSDLDYIGDGSLSPGSAVFDNTLPGNRNLYGALSLSLKNTGVRKRDATIEVFIVPMVSPPGGSLTQEMSIEGDCIDNYYVEEFKIDGSTGQRLLTLDNVLLFPGMSRFYFRNNIGVSFSAGNTAWLSTYTFEHVAGGS
ncbi:MAG: hypothetical protein N0E48_15975 [Candidatus Thiodiazotropha endolucinida]|nr:hypothetical protein [Candidatus Thiodiazotropha taylori]MCW4344829.1 hypothetical protein [Candidatus Thiodiazotropha endolucinida]